MRVYDFLSALSSNKTEAIIMDFDDNELCKGEVWEILENKDREILSAKINVWDYGDTDFKLFVWIW